MSELQKWQKLSQQQSTHDREEQEEALSLIDFPLKPNSPPSKPNPKSTNSPDHEFEFRPSFSFSESDLQAAMCAADDVFLNGTILPLRPSLSSRTDSLDLYSTGTTTSRSASSNSSGTSSHCVSRSHSVRSNPVSDPPRGSISSSFLYTFPSPSPQIRTGARRSNASGSRRSFSSVPTGTILRLGVIPAPEIDIRSRRVSERKAVAMVGERKQLGFGGFGCKCVPDQVMEPVGTTIGRSKMEGGKKEKKRGNEEEKKGKKGLSSNNLKRAESLCRTRFSDWLDELNIGKSS